MSARLRERRRTAAFGLFFSGRTCRLVLSDLGECSEGEKKGRYGCEKRRELHRCRRVRFERGWRTGRQRECVVLDERSGTDYEKFETRLAFEKRVGGKKGRACAPGWEHWQLGISHSHEAHPGPSFNRTLSAHGR